jgi:hypothetical protein
MEGRKPGAGLEVITEESEKALTPEEQARKEKLTEALASPNIEEGTVTIDDEVIPISDAQKQLDELTKMTVSSKTRVSVAPFFNTQIGSAAEAAALRESPAYKGYVQSLLDIANLLVLKLMYLSRLVVMRTGKVNVS